MTAGARTRPRADRTVITRLGFDREIKELRKRIIAWIEASSEDMREQLRYQFLGKSKYFRPLTTFACYQSLYQGDVPAHVIDGAVAVEMFHNVSLFIDDILDGSDDRRGAPTLHRRFGSLPALMASGYIVADGYRLVADDAFAVRMLSELLSRLGVAECMQWRLRRQPLGVEDWRVIAGEDTGSMFEVCANMGTRSEELRRFGRLLGTLYHGCDDVGDARGLEALGGGGDEDVRDGILTLPAALAIRNPKTRDLFCKSDPTPAELDRIARAIHAMLPDAEAYLDGIADAARAEAYSVAPHPEPLLALVDHTRELSQR